MNKQILELIEQMHVIMHRIEGLVDAQKDYHPWLRIVQFQKTEQPPAHTQGAVFSTAQERNSDVGTKDTEVTQEESTEEQGFVEFTDQEIKQMPKNIQRLIIVAKKRCRLRKKGGTYEIRFRRDGYNVSACGTTIELAKQNMLQKLKSAEPAKKAPSDYDVSPIFEDFALFFYEKHKKPRVVKKTYNNDVNRLQNHIFPHIGKMDMRKITPAACQKLVDEIGERGLGKTKDECYSLMNVIFKGARLYGVIDRNPMDIVVNIKHETVNGKELTPEEQRAFLKAIQGHTLEKLFALSFFTGLRPNELKTARLERDFIVANNSKRKNKKIEYKKIYACKHLRPYLDGIETVQQLHTVYVAAEFAKLCPGHTLKDLRRTFNSMCKELGVSDHARMHFMGHSLGAIGKAYTGLSEDYLRKEGIKLDAWEI